MNTHVSIMYMNDKFYPVVGHKIDLDINKIIFHQQILNLI